MAVWQLGRSASSTSRSDVRGHWFNFGLEVFGLEVIHEMAVAQP
jgi:hypothetical protein